MRVRAVHKDQLRTIANEDWFDRRRSPYAEGETVWVPVKEPAGSDREIPERHRYAGRGFFMIGEVAVMHGKRPDHAEVEALVRFRQPRGVLWIEALQDVTRIPSTEILWGDVGEVQHQESGYTYLLDPTKVMFSQGNRNEKERMAKLVRENDAPIRVADMFAGIGYFTIPMAGCGAQVHAMEINPVAFGYLQRNITKNKLSGRVLASFGDCRHLLSGTYDRIIMGHFEAIDLLPCAMKHVEEGSVIHVHSIGTVEERIRKTVEGAGFSLSIHVHKVKKYRPHVWHVVQDVTIA